MDYCVEWVDWCNGFQKSRLTRALFLNKRLEFLDFIVDFEEFGLYCVIKHTHDLS